MPNEHFAPPDLAKLFGVNVSTIKRWVDSGLLLAEKTTGGHRRISQEQLAAFVKKSPKYRKRSYILKRILGRQASFDSDWKTYYRLLRQKKSRPAEQIIERLYLTNAPIVRILEDVMTPALRAIGSDWADGEIDMNEKHRLSFLVRQHLLGLDALMPGSRDASAPLALLACVANEYHEIPLVMVGLVLKSNGWKTLISGINRSAHELVATAQMMKLELICLTKAPSDKTSFDYVKKLARYAEKRNILIALGGAGWATEMTNKTWPREKCVRFFPSLASLDEYLKKE